MSYAIKLISDKQNKFEYDIDSLHLKNIYFNVPIYASVDIYLNDEVLIEINFQEYLDDFYNVDKDDLLKVIDKHFNSYLDYNLTYVSSKRLNRGMNK